MEDSLLVRDASDEQHVGLADTASPQHVARLGPPELVRIDAVVDDDHLRRIDLEVLEDVVPHAPGDRDDPVGRLHRRLLDPAREEVAAAELIGLPRPERLHAVERHAEGDPVERADPQARHVGVPRVRVSHLGVDGIAGHRERDRERLERRRVQRFVLAGPDPVPGRVAAQHDAIRRLGGGAVAEAADLHRHEPAERFGQLSHDHSRAPVDVWRVFAGQQKGLHERSVPSA